MKSFLGKLMRQPSSERRLSALTIQAEVERHAVWVCSGWEMGKRADFRLSNLRTIDLRGAVLRDADLHGANLGRASLSCADLEGADLHRAQLSRADLCNAELRWANLRDADLSRAQLRGAHLRDADLHGADLGRADLEGADLTDADLRGADLARARGLTDAQLARATIDQATRLPRTVTGASEPSVEVVEAA